MTFPLYFGDLELSDDVLRGIHAYGIERPSGIQINALETLSRGKDVIMQATSGIGKTLVFTIALLHKIDRSKKSIQAIVLEPTRELAQQIHTVITTVAKHMQVNCHLAIGGHKVMNDEEAIDAGAQVLVTTEGRLNHLIDNKIMSTNDIGLLVLDEFDKLCASRIKAVKNILANYKSDQLQKFFVSALPTRRSGAVTDSTTAPDKVVKKAKQMMSSPLVFTIKNQVLTLDDIDQYHTVTDAKLATLDTLLRSLQDIPGQGLVFCNHRDVDKISNLLNVPAAKIGYIHSKLKQSDRENVMNKLKTNHIKVLVTSDRLSRCIDVQQIKFVINYDLPNDKQDYIHRIGRCGRNGIAISLVSKEELTEVDKLLYYSTAIRPVSDCWTDALKYHDY